MFVPSAPALLLMALAAACLSDLGSARAQNSPTTEMPQAIVAAAPESITVQGHYDNAIGTTDAASGGTVTAKLIESRPILRAAEVLEFVPGVIVTQHSGDGKANQYFLRGFNLDHGTDFATFVDGMPVNMPTHAHGHGYSDLNWLIPELVDRISYKKGPYDAEEGDFSSAGAARIRLFDQLPRGSASLTLGQDRYARALLTDSTLRASGQWLYALEAAHNDGPWTSPEKFHRLNGVLRFSSGDAANHQSLTAMAYAAAWRSTDQVPQRAVASGVIDRFGAIDPTDGGDTARYSLSYAMDRTLADGRLTANVYTIQSRLMLNSDFTYFLDDPAHGDQFQQAEHRRVYGGNLSRSFNGLLGGRDTTTTLGVQARHDRLDPVGLYTSAAGQRTGTTQESRVRQTSAALYVENATQWLPWLRSVAGLRADRFDFDVQSSIAANSGQAHAGLGSPKLSLILGPWSRTEAFINVGSGFHSNDARGATGTVAPRDRTPIDPVKPLVRSSGGELGLRTEALPGLQSSLALWQLNLDSELVFSGDAGDTQPSRASQRTGLEWNNHWIARPWLLVDADIAISRARYTEFDPAGPYIPGSIDTVVALGATVTELGPWFGQFQMRYFGPRPLIEDHSQRSKSTTLAQLRAGYKLNPALKVSLDVFNLFDRQASDIDYFYTSRLAGEPAGGVADIHSHPVEPRRFRVTLTASF
jgi:outer membrane receptor protein involved in Fe transport